MRFAHPWWFLLLLVVPILWWWRRKHAPAPATLTFSNVGGLRADPRAAAVRWTRALPVVRLVVLAGLAVGLARPQAGSTDQEILTEGVDIILTLDVSGSMLTEDFAPQNRLGAAKEAARTFIDQRQHDRIGLVVFAKHALTQCPLTLDYGVLKDLLDVIDVGMIEDRTAIGTAIAVSANRLRDSPAKSRIVILLTDGVNNAGAVDPVTAARAAAAFQIKIYTIGAGSPEGGLIPQEVPFFGRRYVRVPTVLDEPVLREIARVTGGEYFRAKDAEGLVRIYQQIDRMEKTELEMVEHVQYDEQIGWVLWPILALLLVELILSRTWLLSVP